MGWGLFLGGLGGLEGFGGRKRFCGFLVAYIPTAAALFLHSIPSFYPYRIHSVSSFLPLDLMQQH